MTPLTEQVKKALAGRYEVEREIGRGGMAVVYYARDLRHDRPVALKVLRGELSLGPERFLREIAIVANLNHPHILPLYESDRVDAILYYAMPFVEGETVRQRLVREGPLPIGEVTRLGEQVALALAYAHDKGVVHRDIKPSNVLLSAGQAVVADFGVAYAIRRAQEERLTGTGLAVGSPVYMSPEQASAADVDGRSDIYSLSCVLYEMLTGQPPFGSEGSVAMAQHVGAPVPSPSAKRADIPPSLEATIRTGLAKSPDDRFSDAYEMAAALRLATPTPEYTVSGIRRGPLQQMRNRKTVEWGLTYLAGAWFVMQMLDVLANVWPLSVGLMRAFQILLALGLVVTISTTMLQGESGRRRVTGTALLALAALFAGAAGALNFVNRDGDAIDESAIEGSATTAIAVEDRVGTGRYRDRPSLAVLMFEHVSEVPEDSFFSYAIHVAVESELSKISGLVVLGGRSVARYVGTAASPREISREIQVDYVLESTVRIADGQYSLTTRLIDGRTEASVWSENYVGDLDSGQTMFEMQEDIARQVAAALQTEIQPEEDARLVEPPTPVDEAYIAWMRGRHFLQQGTPDGLQRALDSFSTAVDLDPEYAEAYAGKAEAYNLLGSYFLRRTSSSFLLAKPEAEKALALDDQLAEGHAALGLATLYGDWDWDAAEQSLLRAIELDEDYASAHVWYGRGLTFQGDFAEGLQHLERGVELEPVAHLVRTSLGYGYYFAGDYEQSERELRAALELAPTSGVVLVFLAQTLLAMERYEEAIERTEQAIAYLGSRMKPALVVLGMAHASQGHTAEAKAIIDEFQERSDSGEYVPKEFTGLIHLHLGEYDEALRWFEQAYEERSYGLIYSYVWPAMDPIRDHPRFQDLLRRLGF